MIILKIIEWILYIMLKMVIGVIQTILTFIVTCTCFGDGMFCTVYGTIELVFVVASLLYLPSGIVTVKESWPMFFFGIVLDAILTLIASVGVEGIYAIKGLLSKI